MRRMLAGTYLHYSTFIASYVQVIPRLSLLYMFQNFWKLVFNNK